MDPVVLVLALSRTLWVDLDPEDPVGPWVDLDASTRIGVATTVGTYKASAPAPSDLELISSAASKEKTPGLICLWKFLEENAAIWRFTMNGLHLNLELEVAKNTMLLWINEETKAKNWVLWL